MVEHMLRIEEVRRRQQAAIDEAAAKYLLEKKMVCLHHLKNLATHQKFLNSTERRRKAQRENIRY